MEQCKVHLQRDQEKRNASENIKENVIKYWKEIYDILSVFKYVRIPRIYDTTQSLI